MDHTELSRTRKYLPRKNKLLHGIVIKPCWVYLERCDHLVNVKTTHSDVQDKKMHEHEEKEMGQKKKLEDKVVIDDTLTLVGEQALLYKELTRVDYLPVDNKMVIDDLMRVQDRRMQEYTLSIKDKLDSDDLTLEDEQEIINKLNELRQLSQDEEEDKLEQDDVVISDNDKGTLDGEKSLNKDDQEDEDMQVEEDEDMHIEEDEDMQVQEDEDMHVQEDEDIMHVQEDEDMQVEEDEDMHVQEDEEHCSDVTEQESKIQELPYGSLVWAMFGRLIWPAILIKGEMAGQPNTDGKRVWVMWFGDQRISKAQKDSVQSFAVHFKDNIRKKLSNKCRLAVEEALKVCIDRCGLSVERYKDVKAWGLSKRGLDKYLKRNKDPSKPCPGSEFPKACADALKMLRDAAKGTEAESEFDEEVEETAGVEDASLQNDTEVAEEIEETTGVEEASSKDDMDTWENNPTSSLHSESDEECSDTEELEPMVPELPYGSLVWARFGRLIWPAILIKGEMAGQPNTDGKRVWVMRFGDQRISKVSKNSVQKFAVHFLDHFSDTLAPRHEMAVVEALKVCIDRCGLKVEGYKDVKAWGQNKLARLLKRHEDPFKPCPGSEFPKACADALKMLRDAAKGTEAESEVVEEVEETAGVEDDSLQNDAEVAEEVEKTTDDMDTWENNPTSSLHSESDEECSDAEELEPMVPELPYGSLVWARFGRLIWPAILIKGEMAGQPNTDGKRVWVMWFGDRRISKVSKNSVQKFAVHFHDHFSDTLAPRHEMAVVEALKVCIDRCGLKVEGYKDVKAWGQKKLARLLKRREDPFKPCPGSEFPKACADALKMLRDTAKDSESESEVAEEVEETTAVQDVSEKYVCLACCSSKRRHVVYKHPLFEGFLCRNCKAMLEERLLALDKNGFYMFCAVCCQADSLYYCCEKNCGRTFCSKCLKRFLGTSTVMQIKKKLPWKCLLCTKYDMETHYVLKPREHWKESLIFFFNPIGKRKVVPLDFTYRKIRVLSLYDGISTVKHTLEQLGLEIDAYYSAEIDDAAIKVNKKNNNNLNFHCLGDVNKITVDKLKEICPIDLLVTNPPDQELCVTKKQQKGLNGNGSAIFKVISILRDLETICVGRPVFWLMESTPSMTTSCRQFLDNVFEVNHCMWDAQFFSPYVCPRLYWGNIPGLDRALAFYIKNKTTVPTLKECLDEGRKPRVKMLRQCAIDYKSKKKSREQPIRKTAIDDTIYQLPVKEDGDAEIVRVEEVEKVLGLSTDHTYITNNTIEERQHLLRSSASVFTLTQIFKPLTRLFINK